jgi:hypothetical protein
LLSLAESDVAVGETARLPAWAVNSVIAMSEFQYGIAQCRYRRQGRGRDHETRRDRFQRCSRSRVSRTGSAVSRGPDVYRGAVGSMRRLGCILRITPISSPRRPARTAPSVALRPSMRRTWRSGAPWICPGGRGWPSQSRKRQRTGRVVHDITTSPTARNAIRFQWLCTD